MDTFSIRIDHYVHIASWSADTRLDTLLALVKDSVMPSLKDIQDKVAQLTADVAAETTLDQSIITLIQGDAAIIADLRKQLADAIAAGGDPVALQKVVDDMDAAHTTMVGNATKAAAAVVAGT